MGLKMAAYNELLMAHLNYYSEIVGKIENDQMSFLSFTQMQSEYNDKVEDIMKHYRSVGIKTPELLKINIISLADAAKSAKKSIKIDDIPEDPIIIFTTESEVEEKKEEDEPVPDQKVRVPITKVELLHRCKLAYSKYHEVVAFISNESAMNRHYRALLADIEVISNFAISTGMNKDQVDIILKEAKELFGGALNDQ